MLYRVLGHKNVFSSPQARLRWGWSVDSVNADGTYIAQEAFWFKSADKASTRAREMVEEDATRGTTSSVFEPIGYYPG